MGPVTESQKQQHDYTQKVNEMQKLLPYLEQRITNTILLEESAEELQKMKILQRVLCGQEAVDDSLTLEELDKYAVLLHNDITKALASTPTPQLTTTASFDSNSHDDKFITLSQAEKCGHNNENNTAYKESSETSKRTSSDTTTKEVENKAPVNEENLIQAQENFKINNEATGKKNKSSEAFDTVNKNIENTDETLQNKYKSKSKIFNEDAVALEQPIKINASESADLTNDCAKFDETGENTLVNKKENEALKPKAISELETSDAFNKIKETDKESEENQIQTEHKKLITEDVEELEYEGIELIKIPEETVEDEMILPDSVDEGGYVAHNSDDEEDKESKHAEEVGIEEEEDEEELINCGDKNTADKIQDESKTNTMQVGKSKNNVREGSQEPLEKDNEDSTCEEACMAQPQVEESSDAPTCSIEENNSSHVEFAIEMHTQIDNAPDLEETTHIDDPLGQVDSTLEAVSLQISARTETTSTLNSVEVTQTLLAAVNNASTAPGDNDDDDVEIIESRNSPICLDTDDEDEAQVGKMSVNTRPDTTIARTFTNKKNAGKEKRFQGNNTSSQLAATSRIKTTKSITETINLLDSSDEDEVNSSNATNRRIVAPTVTRSLVKIPAITVGKKRTLLPTSHAPKPLKVSQVAARGSTTSTGRALSANTTASAGVVQKTPRSVLLFPPSFKPTPQSNFLNAVNLLPAAATTGDNPPAFAATLSNKNIIIPNAFYANRRTTNTKEEADDATTQGTSSTSKWAKTSPILITQQLGRRVYREWLEEFIENFADPQQIVSHSCLVLLQSALKYKIFLRIKDLRSALNNKAYTSNGTADAQLRRELYNAFYLNDCRLSGEGMRFCTEACTQIGNNVTLMTDARTGRITLRTSSYEELLAKYGGTNDVIDDKKKRNKYDEEYTPAKYYEKKVEESNVGQGERRKSLRQHRTRCYDETFLYEPEEADDDETPTAEKKAATDKRRQDEQMMALVQRKAEEKRLEAKRQREQQVKSFESAYLEMFAKSLCGKNGKTAAVMTTNSSGGSTQSRSKNVFTDVTATSTNSQIVIDDDDEQGLDDDEPRSHRIYKVVPTRLLAAPKRTERATIVIEDEDAPRPKRGRPRKQDLSNVKIQPKQSDPELITCDSTSGDSTSIDDELLIQPDENVPKNIDVNWHAGSDWCKICNKRIPRTVSHYVNEHPDCEVFISRLAKAVLTRVRKQGGQILEMRPYMNGQEQYAAECVFCNKTCCFKIPYWYQHYSMHTGEYAFRCSGCNTRKTTRSAMMAHINQPCRKRGKLLEDYIYNARARQIEMRVCKICNYMQLNRRNVMKHLRTQHGLTPLPAKHIDSIILLRLPETEMHKVQVENEAMDLSSGGDENSSQMAMTFNYDNFNEANQTGFWDDGDPTDDLSYMICGMLDVELKHSGE